MDALLLPIVKVIDYYSGSKTYVIFNLPKLNVTDQRLKNLSERNVC